MFRDSEHVQFESSSTQKILMIVFGYRDQPLGVKAHHRYLNHLDCKKLFLNPGQNKWYQYGVPGLADTFLGLRTKLSAFRQALEDHKTLIIGHSMGAYAALGIGLHLKPSRILASVPEVTLCMPGSVSAQCMDPLTDKIEVGSIEEVVRSSRNIQIDIVVGRLNAFDLAVARQIQNLTTATVTEIESGHETFVHLRDVGKLSGVFSAFEADRPIQSALQE